MTSPDDAEKIQILRRHVNDLVEVFGEIYVANGFDEDRALIDLTYRIANLPEFTEDVAIAMLAFAARRLWNKRAQPQHISMN